MNTAARVPVTTLDAIRLVPRPGEDDRFAASPSSPSPSPSPSPTRRVSGSNRSGQLAQLIDLIGDGSSISERRFRVRRSGSGSGSGLRPGLGLDPDPIKMTVAEH